MKAAQWNRAAAAAVLALVASGSLNAQVIDLSKIEAKCDGPYLFKGGVCVLEPNELAKLKTEDTCKAAAGVQWKDGKCLAAKEPPSANCGDKLPDLAVKDNKCVIDRKVPRSSQGAYEGDCFLVIAKGDPNPYNLVPGQRYEVASQRDDNGDKLLRVVEATPVSSIGPSYFCKATGGIAREVPAAEFTKIGAERLGWTYGMLTLPFKYYPGDKSLKGAGSLGPYVGRRSGAAGSAITFAATAAVGAVQGESTDDKGNATTPSLFAVSLAAGWMYDISKTPGGKPFKIGFFVGKDFVGADNAAKYPHNRKTWVAFQIGFDFTDN
jgi:hypothetical protein